jgi:hypothetical protein
LKEGWSRSYEDKKGNGDTAGNVLECFFGDLDDISPCEAKEVKEYCSATTLEDLELGVGSAGVRRVAWIDERGSSYRDIHSRMREHKGPLTPTQLYKRLRAPVCKTPWFLP